MKKARLEIGFNFEYLVLIVAMVFAQLMFFVILNKMQVEDAADWFQGVGNMLALVAVLSIPAIQRKHEHLRVQKESDVYTFNAYRVAEQAVNCISAFKSASVFNVMPMEHRLTMNELDVLQDAINGFEVSKMSSAEAAIALLRIKQQIGDVKAVYAEMLSPNFDAIAALSFFEVMIGRAGEHLATVKAEIPRLNISKNLSIWKRIRDIAGK